MYFRVSTETVVQYPLQEFILLFVDTETQTLVMYGQAVRMILIFAGVFWFCLKILFKASLSCKFST